MYILIFRHHIYYIVYIIINYYILYRVQRSIIIICYCYTVTQLLLLDELGAKKVLRTVNKEEKYKNKK
jgi:hypothetical protein